MWRGHRARISIRAIHSHTSSSFRSILCSLLIQTSRGASAGLGSARLWSVRPSSLSHWDLNLKKKHLKELHHSQEVPWKKRRWGFDFLLLVLIASHLGWGGGLGSQAATLGSTYIKVQVPRPQVRYCTLIKGLCRF